jgi:hypothetical protein
MIQKYFRLTASVFALAALQACGGGGGSDAPPAGTGSQVSVPLSLAMANYVKDPQSAQVSITGTANGFAVTGSATVSESAGTPTVFEGVSGFQKALAATITVTANGQTRSRATSGFGYYDSNFRVLGSNVFGVDYCVTTSSTALPALATAGDSGSWYVSDCYTDSSKAVRSSTITTTYVLEPDTAGTLIVKINEQETLVSGTTLNSTESARLTTSGGVTRVSATSVDDGVSLVLTYH